jgi:ATP-dependent DNA helicase PIF1
MLDQMTPVPSSLVLKVGAQVMLMKNINVADGLVNGARGVITNFDDKGRSSAGCISMLCNLCSSPLAWK